MVGQVIGFAGVSMRATMLAQGLAEGKALRTHVVVRRWVIW